MGSAAIAAVRKAVVPIEPGSSTGARDGVTALSTSVFAGFAFLIEPVTSGSASGFARRLDEGAVPTTPEGGALAIAGSESEGIADCFSAGAGFACGGPAGGGGGRGG